MSTDTELIFPPRVIPTLKDARGPIWQHLLETSMNWTENSVNQMGLSLMLARLNNCPTCTTNSYRAMQGCEACSIQSLKRYRGTDKELIHLYDAACEDINRHLKSVSPDTTPNGAR